MSAPSAHDLPAPAAHSWDGFTRDEALAWAGVILRFRSRASGAAVLGAASSGIAAGRIPAPGDLLDRARITTALGFTPETFSAWLVSLQWVPAARYAAHPHNHRVEHPLSQPGHAFDAEVWAGWPFLLTQGLSPEAATHYALLRAEERGFDPAGSDAYDEARAAAVRYDATLARRRAHYGLDPVEQPQRWLDADTRARDRLDREVHESSQTFRERSIRDRADEEVAHARSAVRDGFELAQRRWADALLRAEELRDAVENGASRDADRRRRRRTRM